MRLKSFPKTQNSIRRHEDNEKKGEPNERVESLGAHEINRKSLEHDVERSTDEGADRMAQAPDDRDHENTDHFANSDRSRRDSSVKPDIENAGRTGDDSCQEIGSNAMERDVIANRAHSALIVARRH